jgi:hypothetical protein
MTETFERLRVVSPEARFRVLDRERIEVAIHGRAFPIPLSVHQLLLAFAEPRSAAEVHRDLDLDLGLPDLIEILAMLGRAGVLVAPAAAADPDDGDPFAADLLADPAVRAAIATSLAAGRAVTIGDALDPADAEQLHRELTAVPRWDPFEGAVAGHAFHFRHHNLLDEARFPPALQRFARRVGGARTRALITALSGADCSGAVQVGASAYLPGDYSLPHSDSSFPRSVAFVLHLTKDWDPGWGGGLYWCPSGIQVLPAFNRLTLFTVTPTSTHFVAPVSAHATGRRLAVNGWWTTSAPAAAAAPRTTLPAGFVGECYGAPPAVLAGGRVVAL